MSDQDPVLALLDDLVEQLRASVATSIEVSADSFSVAVRRDQLAPAAAPAEAEPPPNAAVERTQQVHATTVGIFSATRAWAIGEKVARGDVLGAIQSLGHVVEIVAPADGVIREVLVAGGGPVEYGQPLFAILLDS